MGKQYQKALEEKIDELGVHEVRAYIVSESFNSEYASHLFLALNQIGVHVVDDLADANFIISADAIVQPKSQCVTATVADNKVVFAGTISA